MHEQKWSNPFSFGGGRWGPRRGEVVSADKGESTMTEDLSLQYVY